MVFLLTKNMSILPLIFTRSSIQRMPPIMFAIGQYWKTFHNGGVGGLL